VAQSPSDRAFQYRDTDRAGAGGRRHGLGTRSCRRRSGRAWLAALRHAQCRPGARADGEDPRPHQKADQPQLFLSHAAGAEQRARSALARAPVALLSRVRHRSGGADPVEQSHRLRCDHVRRGRGDQAGGRELPFRIAGADAVGARQGRGLPGDELGHYRGRSALARSARRGRHHRPGQRGWRPPRSVPDP